MINTKQMFVELMTVAERKKYKPEFTITEKDTVVDGIKAKSLYAMYMDSVDEYDFAIKAFGSLSEWNSLLGTKWFSERYPVFEDR